MQELCDRTQFRANQVCSGALASCSRDTARVWARFATVEALKSHVSCRDICLIVPTGPHSVTCLPDRALTAIASVSVSSDEERHRLDSVTQPELDEVGVQMLMNHLEHEVVLGWPSRKGTHACS